MRVLLDTHLLLWALGAPARLPPEARRIIRDAEVYVSAASIWEISIKTALGKLSADPQEVLAALEPADPEDLQMITGVGEKKADRFGKRFLETIAEFRHGSA